MTKEKKQLGYDGSGWFIEISIRQITKRSDS